MRAEETIVEEKNESPRNCEDRLSNLKMSEMSFKKRAEVTKLEGNNFSRINMDKHHALLEKRK